MPRKKLVVIPNEVRNPSFFSCATIEEGFLGEKHASK